MHKLFQYLLTVKTPPLRILRRRFHLEWSPNSKLNKKISEKYRKLPLPTCKTPVTYIWIDGTGEHVRSKTRTIDYVPSSVKDCSNWDHDGSSTGLADGNPSDVLLCPIALYNDPHFHNNGKLVLCETYDLDSKPTCTNHRNACMQALNKCCDKEPMFGMEQEFHFMEVTGRPFGWPVVGEPTAAGPYYCGVGAPRAFAREIVDAHYVACLYAGVDLGGTNAEVTPGQWEFQTGPTLGVKAADDLWIARYLLWRIAEEYGVEVSLYPKLFPHWNGAGCHANVSTKEMRGEGGIKHIEEAIGNLEKSHMNDIRYYDPRGGKDNHKRLTGKHETSDMNKFTWGISDRAASVRVNKRVAEAKKGYFEDRRPSSNCDPYQVVRVLINSILGSGCEVDKCDSKK